MTDLSEPEILQALRDHVPSLDVSKLSGEPEHVEMYIDELTSLVNQLRRSAAERERKWARVRFEYLQSAVNQILESIEDEQEEPSE